MGGVVGGSLVVKPSLEKRHLARGGGPPFPALLQGVWAPRPPLNALVRGVWTPRLECVTKAWGVLVRANPNHPQSVLQSKRLAQT